MKISDKAVAGTLESSDVFVEIAPGEGGVSLDLQSVVLDQFGDAIRDTVMDVLRRLGVESAKLTLKDRGALECTIRARVETAVRRAAGERA